MPDACWDSVQSLAYGDHIHLDCLVEQAPAPGSRDWMPLLLDLVEYLGVSDDFWVVTLPTGLAARLPDAEPTESQLFECSDAAELLEPPAVYRINAPGPNLHWEGVIHEWRRVRHPNVLEALSFVRDATDPAPCGRWETKIAFHIGPSAG